MPRKEKPTFVVELHMQTSPRDVAQLNDRMECGKRINNATLQDGLRIVERLRNDAAWDRAVSKAKTISACCALECGRGGVAG
jgi:hypothetical protein